MKYIFDASSIFTAIREKKVRSLNGNFSLEIARYELGNIIWKDHILLQTISKEEAQRAIKTIKHTLSLMDILQIAEDEDAIFETAAELRITFYDASYVHAAKAKDLGLITEDQNLIKKVTPKIRALTLNEFASQKP